MGDPDESVEFYAALSGNQPSARGAWSSDGLGDAVCVDGESTVEWTATSLGNANVDLLEVREPDQDDEEYRMAGYGGLHAGFEVEDLLAVYDRMEEAGVGFAGPWHEVTEEEDGAEEGVGSIVASVDCPDGEHLELIQPTGPFRRREMPDRG